MNALITFWDYINKILTKKLDIFIMIYLNDIIIHTENKEKIYVKTIQ